MVVDIDDDEEEEEEKDADHHKVNDGGVIMLHPRHIKKFSLAWLPELCIF